MICFLPVCMEKVQIIGSHAIGGKAGKLNSSKVYSIESMSDGPPTVFLHVLLSLQHLQTVNNSATLPPTYSDVYAHAEHKSMNYILIIIKLHTYPKCYLKISYSKESRTLNLS